MKNFFRGIAILNLIFPMISNAAGASKDTDPATSSVYRGYYTAHDTRLVATLRGPYLYKEVKLPACAFESMADLMRAIQKVYDNKSNFEDGSTYSVTNKDIGAITVKRGITDETGGMMEVIEKAEKYLLHPPAAVAEFLGQQKPPVVKTPEEYVREKLDILLALGRSGEYFISVSIAKSVFDH